MTPRVHRDPARRPPRRRYADPKWSDLEGRWVYELNPAGRREFDRFLAEYDGAPIRILVNCQPGLYAAAMDHHDREEVLQAGVEAVFRALLTFDEGRSAASTVGLGVVFWAGHLVRKVLYGRTRVIDGRSQRERLGFRPLPLDHTFADTGDVDEGVWLPAAPEYDHAGVMDAKATAAGLLRHLDPKTRAVVELYFSHPAGTMRAIGRGLGVSKEAVRQRIKTALERLRQKAATQPERRQRERIEPAPVQVTTGSRGTP